MLRLFNAIDRKFSEVNGVSTSLVADVHQYVFRSTGTSTSTTWHVVYIACTALVHLAVLQECINLTYDVYMYMYV